jgi:hypothetical protein
MAGIGPLVVKNGFPYSLATGDWIHLTLNEWKAAYQTKSAITFATLQDTLQHMKAHPDEWEGDVFPIIVLVTGGIDCDLR